MNLSELQLLAGPLRPPVAIAVPVLARLQTDPRRQMGHEPTVLAPMRTRPHRRKGRRPQCQLRAPPAPPSGRPVPAPPRASRVHHVLHGPRTVQRSAADRSAAATAPAAQGGCWWNSCGGEVHHPARDTHLLAVLRLRCRRRRQRRRRRRGSVRERVRRGGAEPGGHRGGGLPAAEGVAANSPMLPRVSRDADLLYGARCRCSGLLGTKERHCLSRKDSGNAKPKAPS